MYDQSNVLIFSVSNLSLFDFCKPYTLKRMAKVTGAIIILQLQRYHLASLRVNNLVSDLYWIHHMRVTTL